MPKTAEVMQAVEADYKTTPIDFNIPDNCDPLTIESGVKDEIQMPEEETKEPEIQTKEGELI